MSQPLRAFEPNISIHVIHRGNNRGIMFGEDADYELFLVFLKRASDQYRVAIHAFVLMTTHYHLVVTPSDASALQRAMKQMNVRYVRYFNRKYERIGTLFNGRYRAIPITDENYWLTCVRYVEMNPVRAQMVRDPTLYRWSSYRAHALGEPPSWLEGHSVYDALGRDSLERQAVYRALCSSPLTDSQVLLQKFHAEAAL